MNITDIPGVRKIVARVVELAFRSEMRDVTLIADALAVAESRGDEVVLATVVRTEGSTYRRAGARSLIWRGGRAIGAVSGGCLEADIAARVDDLLASGRPELVTYDTRAGDDLVWGLGLGCNGRVDVLLEPLAGAVLADARSLYAQLSDLAAPVVLTTVIAVPDGAPGAGDERAAPRVGSRFLLAADGEHRSSGLTFNGAAAQVGAGAREALASGRSVLRTYGPASGDAPGLEVLHELIAPPLALLVCGAGADAIPLVRLAVALGWPVTVSDHRPDHVRADRFPGARVLLVDPDEQAAVDATSGAPSAAVVMAHNYLRDLAQLRALLATRVAYIGVLGPRRRTERMIAELGAGKGDSARVHAPIGLDIGAETPDEIALSIVAEIQAVRTGRAGWSLRDRSGGIHGPGAAR